MPYVTENTVVGYMDLTADEAAKLEAAGLLVQSESSSDGYDITALVWDDLGLEGDAARSFLVAALGRS